MCPGTQRLCGNEFCYDPATQYCPKSDSIVMCINTCGQECYDPDWQSCINGILCDIDEDVCEVKYDSDNGNLIVPTRVQCYKPRLQMCLNHTLCYDKDRVCNNQCILRTSSYQICANNGVTLCNVPRHYTSYQPNQIQACNGSCYDTIIELKHCVNGSLQCIYNCSDRCYDPRTQVCVNGTVCSLGQEVCLTNYRSDNGHSLDFPQLECYNPWSSKCIDNALCDNSRVCNGRCITGSTAYRQVCASDKRTICDVKDSYTSYPVYRIQVCNGTCFDISLQQCINGVVSCIDGMCAGECYESAHVVCLNDTRCPVGNNLCDVRYNYNGYPIEPSYLQCYDPRFTRCLNHTLCYEKDLVCNGQCISLFDHSFRYQVCADDGVTLCNVSQHYTAYKPNQIKICNGTCYDTGYPAIRHCSNGNIQCISDCSNTCYNALTHICINGLLCKLTERLCPTQYGHVCYDPLRSKCLNDTLCLIWQKRCSTNVCYDSASHKCFNDTLCSNNRVCGKQCLVSDYQICANDRRTVCNVPKPYDHYRPDQIQLCLGVCYDSLTQQCAPQNISSSKATTATASFLPNSSTNSVSVSHVTVASDLPTRASTAHSSEVTVGTELTSIDTGTSSSILSHLSNSYASLNEASSDSTTAPIRITTSQVEAPSTTPLHSSDNFALISDSNSLPMDTNVPSIFPSTSFMPTSASSINPYTSIGQTSTTPSLQDNCCSTSKCTNEGDCCTPRIECRCYPHTKDHQDGQMCKTIVIGTVNHHSFVAAIAINDKKVVVIRNQYFFFFLLSIPLALFLMVLITISFVLVMYRKKIAMTFYHWHLSIKFYRADRRRLHWERHE
ncbi:unnamed protein product [Adineta ricciae]|uniref:Uncharacterized protein n=1 Tax=Adineta ricciae TaxID=249248 RepID=A0A814MCJ5_ADIRI|nr:unnamed protein product [Adineta ricciae]CAF1077515.1 unnamed protein product [Adineta ricciae]